MAETIGQAWCNRGKLQARRHAEIKKLRRKNANLETLFETALDIVNHREIDQVLQAVLGQVSQIGRGASWLYRHAQSGR